tara:strand:- start:2767 stop:3645 length:879 start_codon:yes stop_codon:yes gene_type:complete
MYVYRKGRRMDTITGESRKDVINRYNSSLRFRYFHENLTKDDMKYATKTERSNLFMPIDNINFKSKFTIGFEIEKTAFFRGAVKEYPLFKALERDGSCGVEAVTNVLPLVSKCIARDKVFGMFHEANEIIDDRFSPSDYRCGGHITVSVANMESFEIVQKLKASIGILYALYRHRLTNTYCNNNKFIRRSDNMKYSPVYVKPNGRIEFRLFSRIQNVQQMILRYKLLYVILDSCINKNNRFATVLRKVKPIITEMYNGDADKVNEIIDLSKHFAKALSMDGQRVHSSIQRFI